MACGRELAGPRLLTSGCELPRSSSWSWRDGGVSSCGLALGNCSGKMSTAVLNGNVIRPGGWSVRQIRANGAMPRKSANGSANHGIEVDQNRSKLEALLYCGQSIPEEKIDKPAGLPANALPIGNKPKCIRCEAKGVVECATCTGSGLYVDSILESQGIIVRVKCLGCGGSGSTMCSKCWGRGHV